MIIQIEFLDRGTKYVDGVSNVVVESCKTPKEVIDKYGVSNYHILTGGKDNWQYRYISYQDKKGDYKAIFTKEHIFVLNDNGKTIGIYKPIIENSK